MGGGECALQAIILNFRPKTDWKGLEVLRYLQVYLVSKVWTTTGFAVAVCKWVPAERAFHAALGTREGFSTQKRVRQRAPMF